VMRRSLQQAHEFTPHQRPDITAMDIGKAHDITRQAFHLDRANAKRRQMLMALLSAPLSLRCRHALAPPGHTGALPLADPGHGGDAGDDAGTADDARASDRHLGPRAVHHLDRRAARCAHRERRVRPARAAVLAHPPTLEQGQGSTDRSCGGLGGGAAVVRTRFSVCLLRPPRVRTLQRDKSTCPRAIVDYQSAVHRARWTAGRPTRVSSVPNQGSIGDTRFAVRVVSTGGHHPRAARRGDLHPG